MYGDLHVLTFYTISRVKTRRITSGHIRMCLKWLQPSYVEIYPLFPKRFLLVITTCSLAKEFDHFYRPNRTCDSTGSLLLVTMDSRDPTLSENVLFQGVFQRTMYILLICATFPINLTNRKV